MHVALTSYTILTRSLVVFLSNSLVLASAVFTGMIVAFGARAFQNRSKFNRRNLSTIGLAGIIEIITFGGLLVVFVCAMCGTALYGIGAVLKDVSFWTLEGLNDLAGPASLATARAVAIAAALPLIVGVALFWVRLRLRSLYGATEIVVGVAVFMYNLSTKQSDVVLTTPSFALAMLTASVYLVVRGLDNLHQGLTAESRDPALRAASAAMSKVFAFSRRRRNKGGPVT